MVCPISASHSRYVAVLAIPIRESFLEINIVVLTQTRSGQCNGENPSSDNGAWKYLDRDLS